jgi:murein DD-endopeptidase MepM/ murein hydrolase activator NlpD
MKKLFPDEKESKGIKEFIAKKGFYIVLLLCIAVVAGTAVYVTTRSATSNKLGYDSIIPETSMAENTPDSLNAQLPEGTAASVGEPKLSDSQAAVKDNKQTSTDTKTTPNKTTPDKTTPDKTTPSKSTTPKTSSIKTSSAVKQQSFAMPVIGDVSFEYANDKLVYSKTLEEWRTHDALDIASDRGTPVKAVADGVISEIKSDPRFGVTVVIDHKNGLKSVYSNLATDDMVTSNQKIKQGEIIGSIGNTAVFESAEQSHLHFQVLKDNVIVDPTAYLPKTAKNATGTN